MKHLLTLMFLLITSTTYAAPIERFVTVLDDYDSASLSTKTSGTLRTVIHDSCDQPGDDWIRFADFDEDQFSTLTVMLQEPISIPKDCNGSVIIDGNPPLGAINPEPIISGERLSGAGGRTPGDLCLLNVYSDNNTIRNLTFMGAKIGAAVCFFGRRNSAIENRFNKNIKGDVKPNRYDIVVSEAFAPQFPQMTGEGNIITSNRSEASGRHSLWIEGRENIISNNTISLATECGSVVYGIGNKLIDNSISASGNHGIVLAGKDAIVFGNKILANGGCPVAPLASQPTTCNVASVLGGAGIYVSKTGDGAEVGHAELNQRNIIQYNISGGVVLENSADILNIHIFHNTISKNYGANIDLADDGISPNDLGDLDVGPNTLFNTAEHVQMFPLVEGRYWGWGLAFDATTAELAVTDSEEQQKKLNFGGAGTWITDFLVTNHTFEWLPGSPEVAAGMQLTPLVHYDKNTSEYGLNIWAKPDADLDGIPDDLETQSNPNDADTDQDGLPDAVEDRNRNGICDADETCAYQADTDADGLSDWAETRGDGRFDAGVDSSPWVPDVDADGLLDGQEDKNNNGMWDGYLGESSPLIVDSDGDGFPDGQDNCPMVPNPQQEPWFCM